MCSGAGQGHAPWAAAAEQSEANPIKAHAGGAFDRRLNKMHSVRIAAEHARTCLEDITQLRAEGPDTVRMPCSIAVSLNMRCSPLCHIWIYTKQVNVLEALSVGEHVGSGMISTSPTQSLT